MERQREKAARRAQRKLAKQEGTFVEGEDVPAEDAVGDQGMASGTTSATTN
jgi:hypothetical protein